MPFAFGEQRPYEVPFVFGKVCSTRSVFPFVQISNGNFPLYFWRDSADGISGGIMNEKIFNREEVKEKIGVVRVKEKLDWGG